MADNVAITAGTGTTVATDEVGGVHYQRVKVAHGADGAATDVSTSSPLPVGGAAADDAAAAGNPVPIGGVYQDSVNEVDAGDVGQLRMTKRRAIVNAADYCNTILSAAVLTSSPIVVDDITVTALHSAKMGSTDGIAYGTAATILIPLLSAGWRNATILIRNGSTAHDQNITMRVWAYDTGVGETYGQAASLIIPAINSLVLTVSSAGAVGQGGIVGGETAAAAAYYSAPAMAAARFILLNLTAIAPSIGDFLSVIITRWT